MLRARRPPTTLRHSLIRPRYAPSRCQRRSSTSAPWTGEHVTSTIGRSQACSTSKDRRICQELVRTSRSGPRTTVDSAVVDAEESSLGPRQMSRLRIIEALYRHPLSSRADLARHTQLSRATVSTLVEELVRAGLVEEGAGSGPAGAGAEGGVGRPPVLLSLVSGAAFALGLDFGHQHIRVALCDLSGEPIVDDYSLAEVDHAPSESLDLAQRLVHEALHSAGVAPDRLLGVGMGLAAPINKASGNLEANGILPGWHGIRPAAEMEARLGIPVALDNDANLGALGEKAVRGRPRCRRSGLHPPVRRASAPASSSTASRTKAASAWRARSVMCSLIHTGRSAAVAIAAAWKRSPAPSRSRPCWNAASGGPSPFRNCSSSSPKATAGHGARSRKPARQSVRRYRWWSTSSTPSSWS